MTIVTEKYEIAVDDLCLQTNKKKKKNNTIKFIQLELPK